MGYENVNPSTLQTLLGSPPVAESGGAAVATSGFGVFGNPGEVAGRADHSSAPPIEEDTIESAPLRSAKRLFAQFGAHMMMLDFMSAAADLDEINGHLKMGEEHWVRYVNEEVQ